MAIPVHANVYGQWTNSPPDDPRYFPLAVWLQAPQNAEKFKAAGINCYVGLWKGPTEEQLVALKAAGMPVICEQNDIGLKHKSNPIIIGWMHGDEPDNAQSLGEGEGYGPPVPSRDIVRYYRKLRMADPTRPVLLNLGQGVAWDDWYGRGVRTNKPEDYPKYLKGCDIASFDIYPAVHEHPEVAGNLWFVPRGVERLRRWTKGRKVVWNCIEASRIGNVQVKPTPVQIKAEVWMSLIHGSMGLIYFVHQFKPKFVEASLLADPELLKAVTEINAQIHELAPVLNSPTIEHGGTVESSSPEVPIALMVKRHAGATYVFSVAMRGQSVTGSFTLRGLKGTTTGEVLGERRTLKVRGGRFQDDFDGYGVHLYRITAR